MKNFADFIFLRIYANLKKLPRDNSTNSPNTTMRIALCDRQLSAFIK